MMPVTIRPMTPDDYAPVYALWQASEGMGLGRADTREAITRYLLRNPGLSFTAWDGDELVGAVLAGHDGRRGFFHHMAVRASHRKQGIGRALATCCEQALLAEGIDKAHLFVYAQNTAGQSFWRQAGWYDRPELVLMSRDVQPLER
jgi:ribosomal protein S18 acetylase RimI-like enzyme